MTFEGRVEKAEKYIRERTGWHGLGAEMLREVFPDMYGPNPTHWLTPTKAAEHESSEPQKATGTARA